MKLHYTISSLVHSFSEERWKSTNTIWFLKGLYCFLFLKLLYVYPIHELLVNPDYRTETTQGKFEYLINIFQLPTLQMHSSWILLIMMGFILIALMSKTRFWVGIIIFLIGYHIFNLTKPINNGSDYIFIKLLFNGIFFHPLPQLHRYMRLRYLMNALHNGALMLTMLQVVMIYFFSGLDKLLSPIWQSGESMILISQLPYYFKPGLDHWFPLPSWINALLSWSVIGFEIGFPIAVWIPKLRSFALVCGLIMHLLIGYFLSLPEFALIMIISYSLFVPRSWLFALLSRARNGWQKIRRISL